MKPQRLSHTTFDDGVMSIALSCSPSMLDLRLLFDDAPMLSGHQHELRHFERFELVTTSLRRFMEKLSFPLSSQHDHTCFVTHASRNDIVMGLISHGHACGERFKGGMILTGKPASSHWSHIAAPSMNSNRW